MTTILAQVPDPLAKQVEGFAELSEGNRILADSGSPQAGAILDGFEPYEGKLSRTVLRGA